MSRRAADKAISEGRVTINGKIAKLGRQIEDSDKITLDGKNISHEVAHRTILLNKPVGYLCSRRSQGGVPTIYELLPDEFKNLKTAGRLDKDSSGLILLTSDGDLAFRLTHPKFVKTKVYKVEIDKPLEPLHQQMISDFGIDLPDGKSRLILEKLSPKRWQVTMSEGRNRQIRRTFAALSYKVTKLHRTNFGEYELKDLKPGEFIEIN